MVYLGVCVCVRDKCRPHRVLRQRSAHLLNPNTDHEQDERGGFQGAGRTNEVRLVPEHRLADHVLGLVPEDHSGAQGLQPDQDPPLRGARPHDATISCRPRTYSQTPG